MAIPVLDPTRWWECPTCGHQHITREPRAHVPMHPCPDRAGLDVPLVEVHTNAGLARGTVRHRVVEREDYEGDAEGLRRADGRPVMAVHTERADGSHDTHVFAPSASATSINP